MDGFLFFLGFAVLFGTVTGILPIMIVGACGLLAQGWSERSENKLAQLKEEKEILELKLKLKKERDD